MDIVEETRTLRTISGTEVYTSEPMKDVAAMLLASRLPLEMVEEYDGAEFKSIFVEFENGLARGTVSFYVKD